VEVVIGVEGRKQLEVKIQSEIARARNRPDFAVEMNKYRKFVVAKATMLTPSER
jgi:hypothetical protein